MAATTMAAFFCAASVAASLLRPVAANNDGALKFNEATFIASHNSHATLAASEGVLEPLGANQENSILDQLRYDGVRGLMLDIMLSDLAEREPTTYVKPEDGSEEDDPLRLVHANTIVTLDYGGMRSLFGANLIPYLEENEDAIVSFFFETDGDEGADAAAIRSTMLGYLKDVWSTMTVKGKSLQEMTFKYDDDLWTKSLEWPTLDDIRESGQRLFVFSSKAELADEEYGFMYDRDVFQENYWEGIDSCEARYAWGEKKVSLGKNNYWSRLFFMNHFPGGSGPDAKLNTVGQNLLGGGNNGWGSVIPRVEECMSKNGGFKPNFLALDWVVQSLEAKAIREYLNFGGRLGTGQSCTDDSHCATSSCNVAVGRCQCQECSSDSINICLGCVREEYCASINDDLNVCQTRDGLEQNFPTGPTLSPVAGASGSPISPTVSPTGLGESAKSTFYCGTEYHDTEATCWEREKCPGGNDDCAEGETCFANINCPSAPTMSPSDRPSGRPTTAPSTSKSPVTSQAVIIAGGAAGAAGANPSTSDNTSFCGTDYSLTKANCKTAPPCSGQNGNALCALLGEGYTCFNNIVCGAVSSPTPPYSGGLFAPPSTTTPATRMPSSSPSTSTPTQSPFDFSNEKFCGGNYTDAKENCYNVDRPCPSGAPSECPNAGICYSGIKCTAPPTTSPTPAQTITQTAGFPSLSTTNGATPGTMPSTPGGTPGGMPASGPADAPNGMPTARTSSAPFDDSLYLGGPSSGSMKAMVDFMSIVMAFGLLGMLM